MVFLEPNLAFSPMLLLTRPRGSAGPSAERTPIVWVTAPERPQQLLLSARESLNGMVSFPTPLFAITLILKAHVSWCGSCELSGHAALVQCPNVPMSLPAAGWAGLVPSTQTICEKRTELSSLQGSMGTKLCGPGWRLEKPNK